MRPRQLPPPSSRPQAPRSPPRQRPPAPAPATAPEPAKSETAPASTGTAPAPAPAAAPVPAPVAAAPAQEEPKKDEAAPVAEVREATSSMYNPPSLFHLSQHTDILQPLSLLVPLRPLLLPPSPPRQPPRRSPPRQPPQPPQPLKHPLPSQPHSLLLACPPPAVPWPSLTLALRRSRSPLLLLQLLQRLPPVPRPLRPLHLLRSRRFFVWRRRSCEEECSVLLVSRNLRV
jgi:hypothetical protein